MWDRPVAPSEVAEKGMITVPREELAQSGQDIVMEPMEEPQQWKGKFLYVVLMLLISIRHGLLGCWERLTGGGDVLDIPIPQMRWEGGGDWGGEFERNEFDAR